MARRSEPPTVFRRPVSGALPMRRRVPLFRPVLFLSFALISTSIGLLVFVRISQVTAAPGRLFGGSVPVYSDRSGRVKNALVTNGSRVEAGEPLVLLDEVEVRSEEEKIRSRLAELSDRVEGLTRERQALTRCAHPSQRQDARRSIERAELRLEQAEARVATLEALVEQGLATRLELEEAILGARLAEVDRLEAEAALPRLECSQGSVLDRLDGEVRGLQHQIEQEKATEGEIVRRRRQSTISSRRGGVVLLSKNEELEGVVVDEGEELLRVSVAPALRFEGMLTDLGRSKARVGMIARVRLEAYPWLLHGTLEGKVAFVSERRNRDGGFSVTVLLDPEAAPGDLLEGMRGTARIHVAEKIPLGRLLLEKLMGK